MICVAADCTLGSPAAVAPGPAGAVPDHRSVVGVRVPRTRYRVVHRTGENEGWRSSRSGAYAPATVAATTSELPPRRDEHDTTFAHDGSHRGSLAGSPHRSQGDRPARRYLCLRGQTGVESPLRQARIREEMVYAQDVVSGRYGSEPCTSSRRHCRGSADVDSLPGRP
jgi:hypothetical protein